MIVKRLTIAAAMIMACSVPAQADSINAEDGAKQCAKSKDSPEACCAKFNKDEAYGDWDKKELQSCVRLTKKRRAEPAAGASAAPDNIAGERSAPPVQRTSRPSPEAPAQASSEGARKYRSADEDQAVSTNTASDGMPVEKALDLAKDAQRLIGKFRF